ncbi:MULTISPECIES: HD domain-containing protein [unclassified Moraxella]|uniref:HD domain-containing protein n=1 Tax=unclassified Moraxella TaxID=2685852 RepID=UPI003AF86347
MNRFELTKMSHPDVDIARFELVRVLDYLSVADKEKVLRACDFADKAHIKDFRKSGEPYVTHPMAVAEILASFRMDVDTLVAALLHDTVEDTEVTDEDVTREFGKTVAQIVNGVTKLKSSDQKHVNKATTFYKIITATLEDPRVLIVKLADRLHNMTTIGAVPEYKQQATAQETLDFYVPFARILGLNDLADYIEILCYRSLNVKMYTKLEDKLMQHGLGRAFQQERIHNFLNVILYNLAVKGYVKDVDNRVTLYRQFFKNRGEIKDLLWQYEFMLVMDDIEDCEKVAKYLIEKYQIPSNYIEDSIRKPRAGGNQSLTLTYKSASDSVKVIILTKTMLKTTRLGILMGEEATPLSRTVIQASLQNLQTLISDHEVNYQKPTDAVAVVDKLINYLHERKIICFTPKGDAYELPRGSTALDFAFAINTGLGRISTGAVINNKNAKLGTVLKSGDVIHIESDSHAQPKAEWLGFVATNKARRSLFDWLKGLSSDERQLQGQAAFARALQNQGVTLDEVTEHQWQTLLEWRGLKQRSELYEELTTGKLLPQIAVSRLLTPEQLAKNQAEAHAEHHPQSLIADAANMEMTFSSCCHPVYGDQIVGHLSKNGLVVHRHKCFSIEEIRKINDYQVIPLHWRQSTSDDELSKRIYFDAGLKINQTLTADQISDVIFIVKDVQAGFEFIDHRNGYTLLFVVVQSRDQIATLIQRLRSQLNYPNIVRLYQWNDEVPQQNKNTQPIAN